MYFFSPRAVADLLEAEARFLAGYVFCDFINLISMYMSRFVLIWPNTNALTAFALVFSGSALGSLSGLQVDFQKNLMKCSLKKTAFFWWLKCAFRYII